MQEVLTGLRDGVRDAPDRDERLQAYWMYRLLFDPDPLRETMTLFWHNHFATSNEKVRDEWLMAAQNELLRSNALGELPGLLEASSPTPRCSSGSTAPTAQDGGPTRTSPASSSSCSRSASGNYTEADIREAARALTGWVRARHRRLPPGSSFDPSESSTTGPRHSSAAPAAGSGRHRPTRRSSTRPAPLHLPQALSPFHPRRRRTCARADRTAGRRASRRATTRSGTSSGMILRSRHFYSTAAVPAADRKPRGALRRPARTLDVPRPTSGSCASAEACDAQGQELFYPPERRRVGRRAALDHQHQRGSSGPTGSPTSSGETRIGPAAVRPTRLGASGTGMPRVRPAGH